jgi:hypothetical protein
MIKANKLTNKKVANISKRRIFLTINKPKINVKGSKTTLPTHQIAIPEPPRPIITAAMAAGLKRCL